MLIRLNHTSFLVHIILWGVLIKSCITRDLLPPEDTSFQRLAAILGQFEDFNFVVHVDSNKTDFLSRMGNTSIAPNPVIIYKYTDTNNTFHRPAVYRCVHYVYMDNLSTTFLNRYASIRGNIDEDDVVIVFLKHLEQNFTSWYHTGVDSAKMTYCLNRTHTKAIFFYYSPSSSAHVRDVSHDKHNVPNLTMYNNDYKNFRGFPLHIGYTRCKPFIYNQHDYLVGTEYKIMEVVVEQLNFTPIFVDYSGYTDGRRKLINDVNKSALDCAIGCLSNNALRNSKVHFSTMLQAEPHILLFSNGGRYSPMPIYLIFRPLHIYVWICCFTALISLSICIKLLLACECTNNSTNPVLISYGILLEQSITIPPKSNAIRFSLITWILVGFVLSSSYKSKLTASLIMPKSKEPNHLQQFMDEGYTFLSPAEDSTYIIELLKLSDDPLEEKLGNLLIDTKDVCEAVNFASYNFTAVVEEQTVIRYNVWNYCNLTTQLHSLRRLEAPLTVNGHMWALPHKAPYKERFGLVLEEMKSFGLVQKWYRSSNITRSVAFSNSVQERGDTEPLEPEDLVAAFAVLGSGCLVAVLVFVFERYVYRGLPFTKFVIQKW